MIAFHFRVDPDEHGGFYGWTIQKVLFRELLALGRADLHLEIFLGDLLVWRYAKDEEAKDLILRGLVGYNPRNWQTIEVQEFAATLFSARVFVFAINGLPTAVQDDLDHQFKRKESAYLGAIEVDPANQVHWVLYQQSLVPRYRYVNGEMRVFYRAFEEKSGADARATGTAKELEHLGFRVSWEDIGARYTVFDHYQSFEHAHRIASLDRYLSEHLARVADEILMRIAIIDPRLSDTLFAALKVFERIETVEEIAQVAVSCRRFLSGLADALYPPRSELVNGRKVGSDAYINRLWAYVEDNLSHTEQKVLVSQLTDVGKRIDAIDALANKGLHRRISEPDLHRLIIALLTIAYDLLTLTAPPRTPPNDPYE